jgi:hypothetical protein
LLDHALSHGAMQVFGVGTFGLRLPSLLGFLLMQVCLFFFVRNLAGERAGVVAAAFPAMSAALYFAAEGRPYGLMLGLYALALWSWQVASRRERARGWALVGLAAAIAATINAHYYGILLLVPVCAAEGWRTVERRQIDWPMCAAILAGMASFLATLPFLKPAAEFKKNYYNLGQVSYHDIVQTYRTLFIERWTPWPWTERERVLLGVALVALVWRCVRMARRRELRIAPAEWVLVLSLALLPFWGYLLARFVTRTISPRFVLGAIVAIGAMVAVAAGPWLRRDRVFTVAMALMGLGIVLLGRGQIRLERLVRRDKLASAVLSPQIKAELVREPGQALYIQDMDRFEEERYYEPDPDVKARMTLVYSAGEELKWNRHDTAALTAMHMEHFAQVPIVSYEALKEMPGEHVFVLYHSGWDWTDQAFAEDGANVRPVGKAIFGDVAAVRFR